MKSKRSPKLKKNNWQFTSVEDTLPPEGDGLAVLAIDDTAPGICTPIGEIMNTTWFNAHYKESKFTHWMLLPPRPMESTEKLLWSEVKKEHRVKLPSDSYNPIVFVCHTCESEQADVVGHNSLYLDAASMRNCEFACSVVGFGKLNDDVFIVTQCKKCEKRWYSHAYRKTTYKSFLDGKLGKF